MKVNIFRIILRIAMDFDDFLQQSPAQRQGHFRLMAGQLERLLDRQGRAWWARCCVLGWWDLLEDMLHCSDQTLALAWRDEQERGWLHLAIYHAMPEHLACQGLGRLGDDWNAPDCYGVTPMEAMPMPKLATHMAMRWWREHPHDLRRLALFSQLALRAKDQGHEELARVWDFWSR